MMTDDPLDRRQIPRAGFDRRGFLKVLSASGVAVAVADRAEASPGAAVADPFGVLVDTTRCIGCRNCELVCAEANRLPEPDLDDAVLEQERRTSERQFSVINRYETSGGEVFVKRQCMHCITPACASACLTRAMVKTDRGPVLWRENKCMGCRYCMVSCPFDMPKFEYHSANPRIRKCTMCFDRISDGGVPACVEECPGEALSFGPRSKLLHEARQRIADGPDDYVHAIYGEHEAGGSCWLYLAAVPFEELGFRTDLATHPYPEMTREFLYGVPVVLTLAPAMLLALNRATRRERGEGEEAS